MFELLADPLVVVASQALTENFLGAIKDAVSKLAVNLALEFGIERDSRVAGIGGNIRGDLLSFGDDPGLRRVRILDCLVFQARDFGIHRLELGGELRMPRLCAVKLIANPGDL